MKEQFHYAPTTPRLLTLDGNSICGLPDLAKIFKGEIMLTSTVWNSFKYQCYIPRRRGVTMTNVEVFQKKRDQLVAKGMRKATKTLCNRSKKVGDKVQASKKHREELNDLQTHNLCF